MVERVIQGPRDAFEVHNWQVLSIVRSGVLNGCDLETEHYQTSSLADVKGRSWRMRSDKIVIRKVEGKEVAVVEEADNLVPCWSVSPRS